MRKTGIILGSLIAIIVLIAALLPGGRVSAAPVESENQPVVAVHVSEYTRSHGLSLDPVSGNYSWYYFQIYTLLEESLIADGTPFVEVSDADIEAGELITPSGAPKYPILISLATECISDAEAQAISSYVSSGGFAYVGSSAWTRNENGTNRASFALSAEMGIQSAATGPGNWLSIGTAGKRIKRIADHRLVDHLTANVNLKWPMPNTYFDRWDATGAHPAWLTVVNGATPLVTIEGTSTPFMAVNSFGSGWFIYHAELSPLAGFSGVDGNVVLLEYAFFRKAIEWAFEAHGLPLVRVSAWPYPNQAAFILRHDDITDPPEWLVLAEEQRNVHGQYFIVTNWCNPAVMPAALANDQSHGAIIGSHSREHIAPDTQNYNQAFSNINDSLVSLKQWLGTQPKTWVSPYLGAILDSSFQAIEDCDITASGGEQIIGPFPHYALSMTEEKKHYSFVEIPPTFWIKSDGSATLTSNDGTWGETDIRNAVDFVYNLSGLVALYDHQGSSWLGSTENASLLHYIDYAKTKPWLWKTTSEEIATWWANRSPVQTSFQLIKNGHYYNLVIDINGASNPLTALDITMPQASPVTVTIDGSPSSNYRQTGTAVKINSGSGQMVEVAWSGDNAPPVAANDAYTTDANQTLSVAAPGVLESDTDADDDSLTAVLVSGVSHGSLTLDSDGSFTYTPTTDYSGNDSFTYKANDGAADSNIATVVITMGPITTFGLDGGSDTGYPYANRLNAMRFRNNAGTGKLTKLEILFDDTTPYGKVRLGVYADNDGVPGSRLVDAGEVTVANGWVSISGLNLPVTQDTYYWLAFIQQSSNYIEYQDEQPARSHRWTSLTYGALPSQFPISSYNYNSSQFVMRATVTTTPPVAVNDTYNIDEDSMLTIAAPGVLVNDTDADGDSLTAVLVSGVSHGNLTLNINGSFTYTPTASYSGTDNFTYKANDGEADSNTATVGITISSQNDPPVAANDAYSIVNNVLTVAAPGVLANDSDADGNPVTAVLVSGVSHGSLTLNSDGSFTYTPIASYSGTDSFTYNASDGDADSNTATVTITVIQPTATFGLNDGNGTGNESSNKINAMRFQNNAFTGTLTKLEILFDDTTPAGKVRLGVYADNSTIPGIRLLDAGEVAVANGWVSISGLSLPVTQDTYYWLAFNLQSSNGLKYQTGQPAKSHRWIGYTYGVLPSQYPDGSGYNNSQYIMRATVTRGGNTAPVALDDTYSTVKDTVLTIAAPGVLVNDTDVDGDPLAAVLVSSVSKGSLTLNSNGSFTYTPNAGYTGSDNFTYKASDGKAGSNTANVAITITIPNNPPVAVDDAYSVDEDNTLNVAAPGVLGNDTDANGNPLTAVLVSSVSKGSLTLNSNGSFTYTPNSGYTGSDSFTYRANDGQADSNTATVSLTVNAVNDMPVAVDNAYSVDEDNTLNVAAPGVLGNDTDAEGNPLTAVLVSSVSNGVLTLNADGSFIYTPNAGYFGSDSFTYKANDGQADSNMATVSITVNAVNDAPVAVGEAYSVDEDNALNVAAPGVLGNDTDVEGDPLAAVLVTSVSKGSLTLNSNGSFTYTPNAGYSGSDSFTYKDNDGQADSNVATVTITVNAVNDVPVAVAEAYSVDEDNALNVAAPGVLGNDTDVDGNPLTAVLVTSVSKGSLTLNSNGSFTYTPSSGYVGNDSFTYKANDGHADSNVATVTITVNAVNDAPVAVDEAYSVDEDNALNVAAPGVLGNDTDVEGDPLAAVLVSSVSKGSLTLNSNGSFTYTPNSGYIGSDSFTYKTNDGHADSNVATVTITVNAVNPEATFGLNNGNNTWNESLNVLDAMRFQNNAGNGTLTKLEILFDDTTPGGKVRLGVYADSSGVPGSLLLAASEVTVANGWVSINGLSLPVKGGTYYWLAFNLQASNGVRYQSGQPASSHYWVGYTYGALPGQYSLVGAGYNGNQYVMRATVALGGNTVPSALGDAYSVVEDNTLNVAAPGVLGNDTDVDGDPLTAVLVSGVSKGVLTLNSNGSFTYTPNAGYSGSDSFTYKANDGQADSNVATVTITVNDANDAPVAVGDDYSVVEDNTLNVAAPGVLGNDTDVEGDPLTAVLVSSVGNGSLTLNIDGSFTYTPSAGYVGNDSFTYKASDGQVDSNVATVSITVNAVNDTPVAVGEAYSVVQDNTLIVVVPGVLGNDTDVEGNPLTAVLVSSVSKGSLTLNSNGSFTYTPNAGYSGSDSFTYKASDGQADSNVATVTITITIKLEGTFGLSNGNNFWYENPGILTAMRFQNSAGSGTLTKLEILINDAEPTEKVRLGVYSDNSGVPGSLLLDAGETAVANGWVSINGLSLPVTQGTYYWLAFNLQDTNGVRYQSGQPASSHYFTNYPYGALPTQYSLVGAGSNNNQYVMRATITIAGP